MSITTYTELKTAVANWLARDDLTDFIPDFITLCESQLNRNLFHPGMETRSRATVVTTSDEPQFVELPTDFQSMRRLYINNDLQPTLDYVSEVQASKYRASIADAAGLPRYYTIFGSELELIPTPDSAYQLEMVYRGKLTALSTTDTSNWLLALAPDVYLYGSLMQAAPFVRDQENLQMWGNLYAGALDALNLAGRKMKYGQTPLRITLGSEVTP